MKGMHNVMYGAIGQFYNIDGQSSNTHRLMILPAGMLGVDAVVASELLERDINKDRKESITYRYVETTSGYKEERSVILNILLNYFDNLKAEKDDLVQIIYLGVFIRPSLTQLRELKEIPQHICVIDVYNSHAYEDIESISSKEDVPAGDVVRDYCVSYGDVPTKVLGKFVSKYIREMDRDVEYQFGIKRLGRTTDTMYAEHVYAPLKDRTSSGINVKTWGDHNIETKDLYSGDPLSHQLNPVLMHYMVYQYWHRIDPDDLKYQKYLLRFIMGITDDPEDVDIETIVVNETQILRCTFWDMMSSMKRVSNPYTCEVGGQTLTFSPPAIVEYDGSLNHQRPYEGVIADFMMRKGFILVDDNKNVRPIELDESRSLKARFYNYVILNVNEPAPEEPNYQKVELLVMRDTDTGAMVVRSFIQKKFHVVRNAMSDALTNCNTTDKRIVIAPHSNPNLMLSIEDFVYNPALADKTEG